MSAPEVHQLLPAGTRLGPVHIGVTDAERARTFWTGIVGLSVVDEHAGTIGLGAAGRALVILHPGAASVVPKRRTGLYHLAIHFARRKEFARAIARVFKHQWPNSPTDHLVTETTYLWDPDGNGIEFTFETPQRGRFVVIDGQYAARTPNGRLHSGREPLDMPSVFSELSDADDLEAPIPDGIRIGHVHLHVADIDEAMRFYRDVIGFHPLMYMPAIQMADANVDGAVPHTIAVNTWAGLGAPPPPKEAAGLKHFTLELPDASGLKTLTDRLRDHDWPFEQRARGIRVLDPSANALHIEWARSRRVGRVGRE